MYQIRFLIILSNSFKPLLMATFGDCIQKVALIVPVEVKIERVRMNTAQDSDDYTCPHCSGKVKLVVYKDSEGVECRKFKHVDESNICPYYASKGVESDDHWAAKQALKQIIDQRKKLLIQGKCLEGDKDVDDKHGRRYVMKYTEKTRVELEYVFEDNTRGDVVIFQDDEIECVIEVFHTSEQRQLDQNHGSSVEAINQFSQLNWNPKRSNYIALGIMPDVMIGA